MRIRRIAAAIGTAAASVAAVVVLPAGPASAGDPHPPYHFDRTPPVGWIDADGVHTVTIREGNAADAVWLRMTVDGVVTTSDQDWPDPAGNGLQQPVLAADDAGHMVVAVAGRVDTDLWMNRFGPDGSPIGSTVVIEDETAFVGLDDGSILTSAPVAPGGADTVWRSADGTERARIGLPSSSIQSAAVDGLGRLLVADDDGQITRWTATGDEDLVIDTPCDAVRAQAVVVDSAGGFASACGSSTGPLTMTIDRFSADGAPLWSLTTTPEAYGLIHPDSGIIDDAGRVWISGLACPAADDPAPGDPAARCPGGVPVVRALTADGLEQDSRAMAYSDLPWSAAAAQAPMRRSGDGIVVIRSVPPSLPKFWVDGYTFSFPMPEPSPVPACRPSDVVVTGATASSASVSFSGCAFLTRVQAESDPTEYRIQAIGPGEAVAASAVVPAADSVGPYSGTVSGLEGGVRYRFVVRAENAVGLGLVGWDVAKGMTPPFAAQSAFVARQYTDLVGRAPTSQELTNTNAVLDFESATPAEVVDELLSKPWSGPSVDPLSRLYRAYFGRNPDTSGLRYWVGKRRSGAVLNRISSTFAGSSEFQRRYGSLTDRAFVELVYQNVLGRAGDPGGIAYWTGQLDQRRRSRGQVMVGFSESREFARRVQPDTDVVAVVFGLLDRAPTASEVSTWRPLLAAGTSRTVLIGSVLGSPEYQARVQG